MLINPNPSISDDKNPFRAVITTLSRFFWISDQFVVSDSFENIYREYGYIYNFIIIYMFSQRILIYISGKEFLR